MKKFMEGVMEWKTYAALMFSGVIMLNIIVSLFLGESTVPIVVIIYLLIMSMVGTFLQFLAFTDRIIKKMRYTYRMILFVIPFFIILAASAYLFEWFPLKVGNWLTFTAIYLVVFIVATIAFEIYYRWQGKKYDGLLGQYRKQKEIQK